MDVSIRYNRLHQLHNAKCLQQTRGTFAAAMYMRALGWSIEATMWVLCRKEI